ncbi:hypothetical protein CY35_02G011000, partial [Sphagnum magellanicum]
MGYTNWLRVHGKLLRPDLSKEQHLELKECFELLDTSGSGWIHMPELVTAFHVLGMDVKQAEVNAIMAEASPAGNTHMVEFAHFMQIMMKNLDKIPTDVYVPRNDGRGPSAEYSLPFCFLAQAYRRKKLIEAVMEGNKATIERIKYRTFAADMERQALKDEAAGKSKQVRGQLNNRSQHIGKMRLKHGPKKEHVIIEAPFPPYSLRDMNPEVKVLFSKDEQHIMEDEKDQVGGQPDDAK